MSDRGGEGPGGGGAGGGRSPPNSPGHNATINGIQRSTALPTNTVSQQRAGGAVMSDRGGEGGQGGSITSELPWSHCDNKWNTKEYCITDKYSKSNELFTMIYKWSMALLLKPYKILHILIDMTFLL